MFIKRWYELMQFLNMSGLEIKTWWNTLIFEQTAQRMFGDKVIPWIAASKSSDQKSPKMEQPQQEGLGLGLGISS